MMKVNEILKFFLFSNFRHLLTFLVGVAVSNEWITKDSISNESIAIVALALVTYLLTVGYSLFIKIKSRYKFLSAMKAEPGTPAAIVKAEAAEKMQKDIPITKVLPV